MSAGRFQMMLTVGLPALAASATLGDGGSSPGSMAVWHGLLAILFVIGWSAGPGARRAWSPAVIAFVVFLAIVGVLGALAPYRYGAWLVWTELAAFLAAVLVAAELEPRRYVALLWPLRVWAAGQGGLVLYQKFVGGELRPAGSFLDTNHMSGWVGMVLLLSVASLPGQRLVARRVALGLMLPMVGGILVSGSRSALLGLGCGAAFLVVRSWSTLETRQRRVVVLVGLVALSAAGIRVAARMVDGDRFRHHRFAIWKASVGPLIDAPWTGSGPGQYALAARGHQFPDGEGPLGYDKKYRATHSDLIRIPVEFGIPAGVALLLALGLVLRRRGPAEGPSPPEVSATLRGARAALILLGVQALVSNASRWPAAYVLAALLFGLLLSQPIPARVRPVDRRLRIASGVAMLGLFCVLELVPTVAHFRVAGLPRGRLDENQRQRLIGVVALNPIHPDYRSRVAENLLATDDPLTLAGYVEGRESAERAVRLSPRDARYTLILARIEARALIERFGDVATRDRAVAHYERARLLDPYDARLPVEQGALALQLGDPDQARRLAETALRLEPRAVTAHLLLAEALIAADPPDPTRAADRLNEAAELASEYRQDAAGSSYAADLLSLDRDRAEALRARLLERKSPEGAG